MNCTCSHLLNGIHTNTLCPFYFNNTHSYHTHSYGTTSTPFTYAPLSTRSAVTKDEPEFDDVKVEKRWEQLRDFNLDLPSNNLNRDLEEKKRVLLQRGLHVREVLPAPDLGDGIVQFIAATEGVKRDGNTLVNTGWQFDNFAKNPVFLFQHDYSQLPIGQHIKWAVTNDNGKNVLRVWSRFVSADIYPFADRVRMMYEKGFLRAVSIGWIPLEYEPVRNADGDQTGWKFTKNELLEVSAVSVPADPDAIIQGVNQRILEPSDLEVMATYIDSVRQFRNICHIVSNIDAVKSAEAPVEQITEPVENSVKVCLTVEIEDEEECEMDDMAPEDDVVPEPGDNMDMTNKDPEVRIEETPTEQVSTEETPVEERVIDQELAHAQLHDRIERLTNGKSSVIGSEAFELMYAELQEAATILDLEIPTQEEIRAIRDVRRQLYARKVMDLDAYEQASTEDLINALMYHGILMPDVFTNILNSVRDVVDNINDVTRGIEFQVRVGSKISKSTKDTLDKCNRCLDDAKAHINSIMATCDDTTDVPDNMNDKANSVDDTEQAVINDIAERAAKLARSLRGEPEPVVEPVIDFSEVARRVADLRRNVVEKNVDAISTTTKSTYIRELLQKIIDSEK